MFGIIFLFNLILVMLTACTSKPPALSPIRNVPEANPADTNVPQTKSKEGWELRWEGILEGAKKEGKVVIYGVPTGAIRDALVRVFTGRFGISAEYMAARGPEIAAKLQAERRAMLYYPDVIIGASSPAVNTFKPSGWVDPIEPVLLLPEVIDPKLWWDNKFPWVDKDYYFVAFLGYPSSSVTVNSDLVKPDDIKSYRDLLEPKWKGKIAMHDPSVAGSGQLFVAVHANYIMGQDFLKQLAAQEPFISRDLRLLVEWVARGKYLVGIALDTGSIKEMKSIGAPLQQVVPKEGVSQTTGAGFLSLPKNVPHPNTSTLFINWILSKEGQTTYAITGGSQSAREDIPTNDLDPLYLRKPGAKYFRVDTEEFWLKGAEYTKLGADIFGHLIR